jgi:hypothetical protein
MEYYSEQISQYWPTILQAWNDFRDKNPIIECDLSEQTVSALPAIDYINYLSENDRVKTRQIYDNVTAKGGMMVFIRDNEKKTLQSYTYGAEELE